MSEIRVVTTPQDEKLFLQVHVDRHIGNPDFSRPLDKDVNEVFDPNKNKTFRFGEAERWLLCDDAGKAIGRIAAFTNEKYTNKGDDVPVGGMGFFECVNDQGSANLLFDTAKNWLAKRGMEAMDGPINFGERDKWWGLLIDGYEAPLYGMNYNPPYYQELLETYGFQLFYNQICWTLPVVGVKNEQLQPKFYEAHDKFANNPDFEARHLKKGEAELFAKNFCTIYNKAWAKHEGGKEMETKQALKIYQAMKPIMDEHIAWFTYHKGEPIAMWMNIPDINQVMRHLNGKFGLFSKLKFAYLRWRGGINRMVSIIFGVVPEFQGSGIDYYMIVEAEKVIKKKGRYTDVEMLWQGDFNPKILAICENLGSVERRRMATFRYLFDRKKEYKRHPILNY